MDNYILCGLLKIQCGFVKILFRTLRRVRVVNTFCIHVCCR